MARRARQNEMSGIFDFLKGKKKSEQKSLFDFSKPQLPALPPKPGEMIPAPKPERGSVIDVFRAKPHLPAVPEPSRREITPADVLAPRLPARRESAPPTPPPVQWQSLIPAAAPKEERPMSEVARTVFAPSERPPTRYVFLRPSEPPQIAPQRPHQMIVHPQGRTEWKLPTVEELADHFRKTNNLDAMWNFIRETRAHPDFKVDQQMAYYRGEPMVVPIDPVSYRERYTDFANFYGIPWAVMETYLNAPEQYEKEAEEALWRDVLSPLNIMVPEAFELLKPDDIPGFFNVSFVEPSVEYSLVYVEPLFESGGQGAT
jgi:hypothetical protein